MVSITAFGQSGPYRDYKGYAINASALGGQTVCAGEKGREPLTPPLCLGHYQSGTAGATAAMGAIFARENSGNGQHVDVSEAQVWATLHTGNQEILLHPARHEADSLGPSHAGHLPVHHPALQGRLHEHDRHPGIPMEEVPGDAGGRTGAGMVLQEPRYQDRREISLKYADEMDGRLAPWLTSHSKAEIYQLCLEKKVPFAPVRNMEEVVNDAHLRLRELLRGGQPPGGRHAQVPRRPGQAVGDSLGRG